MINIFYHQSGIYPKNIVNLVYRSSIYDEYILPPISVTHIYRTYDKSGIYLKYMNEYILPPI